MGSGASRFDVKRVAIIGAGPCGLSAAKYLKAQGTFDTIVVFEQQDEIGGVWNYSQHAPDRYAVPQRDPFYPPDPPFRPGDGAAPIYLSAMYEQLHANIQGSLMQFSDQDFPEDAWCFPRRETLQQYLLKYAEDVRGSVRFCHRVDNISLTVEKGRDRWIVEATSTLDEQKKSKETFDAVVIANSHYSIPFVPAMKNMEKFHEAHPSIITHSKQYRTPESFADKKTVIVGNGPSGLDIAFQINHASKHQTLLSVRSPTPADKLAHVGCEEIGEIDEFLIEERGVRLKDGKVVTDIDAVVFCTGFLFSYPFLSGLQDKLITSGSGVHNLYKHLFFIPHPTLAFPGLNMKAVPWPLSEVQAAVFSAVWSNQLDLPSADEMQRWSDQLEGDKHGKKLHVFGPMEDAHYINELHDWAVQAKHLGKKPPYWDGEKLWERQVFASAKLLFEQQGCKAKTLADLGLYYEPEKDL